MIKVYVLLLVWSSFIYSSSPTPMSESSGSSGINVHALNERINGLKKLYEIVKKGYENIQRKMVYNDALIDGIGRDSVFVRIDIDKFRDFDKSLRSVRRDIRSVQKEIGDMENRPLRSIMYGFKLKSLRSRLETLKRSETLTGLALKQTIESASPELERLYLEHLDMGYKLEEKEQELASIAAELKELVEEYRRAHAPQRMSDLLYGLDNPGEKEDASSKESMWHTVTRQ